MITPRRYSLGSASAIHFSFDALVLGEVFGVLHNEYRARP
jgi:hypothetical protein